MDSPAVATRGLTHRYGDRLALDGVSLEVAPGEIVALLGPNGGGKSTLLRLLTTSLPIQEGAASVLSHDVAAAPLAVRQSLGVVFQHPSLDKKLSVAENLRYHAMLYGMDRRLAARRADELLEIFGLAGRRRDRVETLSGGLARRVEIAKALMPEPRLLVLDEPSVGLDPLSRRELWTCLEGLRSNGVTLLLSTHLMDEAERAGRVAILDRGRLVAIGAPNSLRAEIGGDVVRFTSPAPDRLASALRDLALDPVVNDSEVRVEHPDGLALVGEIARRTPSDLIDGLAVSKPTLEDVFLRRAGHRFEESP